MPAKPDVLEEGADSLLHPDEEAAAERRPSDSWPRRLLLAGVACLGLALACLSTGALLRHHRGTERRTAHAVALFAEPPGGGAQAPFLTAVINLQKRPDRWLSMQHQLQQEGIQGVRWEAVDGDSVNLRQEVLRGTITATGMLDALKPVGQFGMDMTPGAIGCALSHQGLWEMEVQASRPLLILEDDAELSPGFRDEVQRVLEQAKWRDWDLILLGRHMGMEAGGDDLVEVHDFALGLFAYLVSPSGARRLLEALFPLTRQLDTELSMHLQALRVLRVPRALARSEPSRAGNTDIQRVVPVGPGNLATLPAVSAAALPLAVGQPY